MTFIRSYWPHKGAPQKLSISALDRAATTNINLFNSAHGEFLKVMEAFVGSDSLLPRECDQLIRSIRNLQKAVDQCSSLIDSSTYLPDQIVPRRYGALLPLQHLSDLSEQSLLLIQSYRSLCLEPSAKTFRLYGQIRKQLERILETSSGLEDAWREMLASNKITSSTANY